MIETAATVLKAPAEKNGKVSSARIAYVSLVFRATEGVLRKLSEQAEACKRLALPFDIVWITSDKNPLADRSGSIRSVLLSAKNKLQFRIQQVRALNKISREYDAIFLRYPLVDPISLALFSPGCPAISEHHTKELEETRLMRDWRYPFEKYGARNFLNRFSGISAVTDELLQYELKRGN